MAEILLSVALEELLSKAVSLAATEFALSQSFKKELIRLSETLNMIRAVLGDVERRQLRDEHVKLWLKKLKDVACEADNVLDEVGYDILRPKVEIQNKVRRKVHFFFSASNLIALRQNWAHKIKSINASLKTVNNEAKDVGLQMRLEVDVNDNHQVNLNRETDSVIEKSETVGRENDLSEMMKILIESRDDGKLSVIPIVGMGGIGKTTLAKLIYNDERVRSNYRHTY